MKKTILFAIFSLMLCFLFVAYHYRQWIIVFASDAYMLLIDGRRDIDKIREESAKYYNGKSPKCSEAYIAHGGGIMSYVYTNSQEAVKDSLNKGFKYIEIDFHVSRDNRLVGVHDWNSFKKRTRSLQNVQNMTLNELLSLKIDEKYKIVSGEFIRSIMQKYPDMILVTDKITDYNILMKEIPYPERMIVEVPTVFHYFSAINSGVKYPAFRVTCEPHLWLSEKYEFPIIVVYGHFFQNPSVIARIKKLHDAGIVVLVFSSDVVDNPLFVQYHLGKTVSKIYTDLYSPNAFCH